MNFLSEIKLQMLLILLFDTVTRDSLCQLRVHKISRGRGKLVSRSTIDGDICTTPTAKFGNCVLLLRCRRYWGRGNMPDVTNSSCGENTMATVCCPLAEDDETTVIGSVTTEQSTNISGTTFVESNAASQSINSTHKSRRMGASAFPEDCGQSGATFRRIIGGEDSVLGAWPWMAAIYLIRRGVRSLECGGALITASHVLTAAHCVITTRRGTTLRPRQILVRLGELNLVSDEDGANPIDVPIRSIIKHEGFSLRTFQNDLAILELQRSVEFNGQISPICLPFNTFSGDEELIDRNAVAAGWGSTRFGGPGSPSLQEVSLRMWDNELCREVFQNDVPITDVNLCAGDGDKDACRGDSGGPLMLADSNGKFNLVGIVSFGKKCAEPGVPGVYTRVTTFLDWIEQKIG